MKHTGKKLLSLVMAILLLSALTFSFAGCGKTDAPCVYVTIADENGNIAVMYEKVAYTENMTVDGALHALHEEKCKGGYASEQTDYGLSMTKLWGVENGGSYGYYVNNASPSSLSDTVKENDHIYAYVYTDTQTFSDMYAFFGDNTAEAEKGGTLTLELSYSSYDASWNLVTLPVSGASIYIDGKATNYTTNAEGKVEIKFDKKGTYTITARHDSMTLVPAFTIVSVK
jgi:hypothetical protein